MNRLDELKSRHRESAAALAAWKGSLPASPQEAHALLRSVLEQGRSRLTLRFRDLRELTFRDTLMLLRYLGALGAL